MDQAEMKKVFCGIKKRMSSLDVSGIRESRKVEGLYSTTQEARGFPNLLIYLDQGLSGHTKEIADILTDIDRYLGGFHNDGRMRYLFTFGGSDGTLVRHAKTDIRKLSREQWQQWTEVINNANVSPRPVTIPALFYGTKYGSNPCPGKRDLLIFFSSVRHVFMPENVGRLYAALKKNALWFFFSDGSVEYEFGMFDPCILEPQE
jgi:hypothetical protein